MKIYFSPSSMGFYDKFQPLPTDVLSVTKDEEEFIREAVIWGASEIEIINGKIIVTYPSNLKSYVETFQAPNQFP